MHHGPRWRRGACGGRCFLTTETVLVSFDALGRPIRVPPLRVRRQDLGDWLRCGVRLKARSLGWSPPPVVAESLVKRLQTYDFPGNLRDLSGLTDRALRQCDQERPAVMPEEVFWTDRRSQSARFDLWRWKPQLQEWMRSPRLWNGLLYGLVSWLFVLVNLWLWRGPQERDHNGALLLF
jgi:transcriptional regulator with AAA-type ATPase domain